MGYKIFVSYKYADGAVKKLQNIPAGESNTVRNYVDLLQDFIDRSDHINKGEDDGEDMSTLKDSTIASKLGDKIFDSSVTIVFISKNMRDNTPEEDQWIPWEISYSLKEQTREGGRSKTNAVLAVVLPDENDSYEYFITENTCSRTIHTKVLFKILRDNMFNQKNPDKCHCQRCGREHYRGESSYIEPVKWADFKEHPNLYIEKAVKRKENIENYNITKLPK